MVRIKINDLPEDHKISPESLKRIMGGGARMAYPIGGARMAYPIGGARMSYPIGGARMSYPIIKNK